MSRLVSGTGSALGALLSLGCCVIGDFGAEDLRHAGLCAPQIAALKNLKLNIRRAKLKGQGGLNKFYITDAYTSEKITKSRRLEEIRLTILNNLLKFHPESGASLAWGTYARKDSSREPTDPLGPRSKCAAAGAAAAPAPHPSLHAHAQGQYCLCDSH
jgi:hypothetical protein